MKRSNIHSAIIALALLLSASLTLAAEDKAGAAVDAKKAGSVTKLETSTKAKSAAPAAKLKLVDINSAGKAELKTLPGIGDADADKIVAGRPYLSKANLLTHNIVSKEAYEAIRGRVIAKQNKATEAKLKEMQKGR